MNYDLGQPFIQITFPTRNTMVALFRREDILRVRETKGEDGKPLVTLSIKAIDKNSTRGYVEWYFDGTMEDFKNATTTVYL